MASLGWDKLQTITSAAASTSPCHWSHQQFKIGENSSESSADHSDIGSKMDVAEGFIIPSPMLQGVKMCNTGSNSTMVEQMVSGLDSINGAYNLNISQWEDATRLAADTMLVKSGVETTWGEALTAQLCSSPLINRPYIINPLSGLMEDFGTSDGLQVFNDIDAKKVQFSTPESIESLDCLLSATNRNGEDDGISVVFSDCKNLWNLSSGYAVSSGESENDIAYGSNKEAQWWVSEQDNAVSAHLGSSNTRPNCKSSIEEQEPNTKENSHYFDLLRLDASIKKGVFRPVTDNPPNSKKPRSENHQSPSTIDFSQPNSSSSSSIDRPDTEAIAHMKEMIYRAAVFRPVNLGFEMVEKPKRKNVRISSDPQTVAARQRRERISEKIKILQRLVPGGSKMDTASMLDEAANYLKFLKSQVNALEALGNNPMNCTTSLLPFSPTFNPPIPMQGFFSYPKST